jgi:histidyl-tRNA synthetase
MNKKDEPVRPEARLPKGLNDTSAEEIRATERMLTTIRGVFESYGFEPLDTPAIEYADALGKFLPDQDRPNEGVFSFKDEDGQWLSLRYDLTAPLARYVAANYATLPKPFRRYQSGPVWRNEKPGPGRFRQFTQFDADTVGASSVAADAELCMLATDTLEALGVPRGDYVINISSRMLLEGLKAAIPELATAKPAKWLAVLRAIDKLDRLDVSGVRALLGKGRTDESGDLTKGAGLTEEANNAVMGFVTGVSARGEAGSFSHTVEPSGVVVEGRVGTPILRIGECGPTEDETQKTTNQERIEGLRQIFPDAPIYQKSLDELLVIAELTAAAGYDGRVIIDPSVVRGLEYYTGPVFEAELTAPIVDVRGQPIRLGSVVSGGRYDGLVERFTGEKVPATGISIGVSRLLYGLQTLSKSGADAAQGPVVVLVLDRDRVADYQSMAMNLRNAGIRAELYLGDSGMKAQMKYADKRGSPCVVIQGGDERARGEVTIKDLIEGARLSQTIADNVAWREERPGQFTVPEADMVKAVRGVLSRHQG